jgi:HlyD family secretion protein
MTARSRLGVLFLALGAGCEKPATDRVQGYVEGEYVYVAAPYAGELKSLAVDRGARVKEGDALFALDPEPQRAARDEARRRVTQARANLEDLTKGKRPTEIESLDAQLKQAQAALVRSEAEYVRVDNLVRTASGSLDDLDRARSLRDQDRQRVAQYEADLKTARLGARADQVEAAEANLRATEAALARADWDLAQKRQAAAQAGLIFDVLYRPGEWVPAGKPVVVLLPPQNVKVRAFVPEVRVGSIQPGQSAEVFVDGLPGPLAGKVSFISPRAEYTPPVIYSQESRGKLVFMVEVVFDPATAATLHPGQPVDVRFGQ